MYTKVNQKTIPEKKQNNLEDIFNIEGSYKDLISSRVNKGNACITMGNFTFEILLLLYKTVFIPTVIYNSETWCGLNKTI